MRTNVLRMSRSQNFKSHGRGKHSNHPGTVVNSSIQFDKFFFNNSNKPTASKSAGTIGKWGVTSFTSLRSSSFTVGTKEASRFSSLGKKRTQPLPDPPIQTKRPVLNNNFKRDGSPLLSNRKFFKSRNSSDTNNKSYKSSSTDGKKSSKHSRTSDENKKQKNCIFETNKPIINEFEKPLKISTRKVAPVKITNNDVPFNEGFQKLAPLPSPPKERDKPPIVLRIFKGRSQLISETGSKSDGSDLESSPKPEPQPEEDIFNENTKENIVSLPEFPVTSRVLRRRNLEEVAVVVLHPEPIPSPKEISRRAAGKAKSLSPEPTIKTRGSRRRSPIKSKCLSPEPAITTRSLRRRQPPSEMVPPASSPPHASPKRTLRSTKTPSLAPFPPAGKIVITNLNSDHPSVYLSDDGAPAPLHPSPRKEVKEHRSFSNKHKKKESKPEVLPVEEKVEELLANIEVPQSNPEETVLADVSLKLDTSLDEDRAELLQLLEDDEDEWKITEPKVESTIVCSDSVLKIKIKLPKPIVKEESTKEPVAASNFVCDSQDSGIDLKSEVDSNLTISTGPPLDDEESCELSKDGSEKVADLDDDNPNEISGTSVPIVPVASKKGSFFKHRGSNDGNKKRLALYKHKWTDDKDSTNIVEDEKNNEDPNPKILDAMFDIDIDEMPLTKFIRQPTTEKFDFDDSGPITGVKCSKKNKDFYTVVRNVKKAHQIQESGEFQEFNDDVEYILDALQDNNPVGTRCLSAITLATKCTEPAFRMHVRAHGTVTKFFRTLHDATKDQSLGLCTATVMFVLSQDRLNMDLDRDSLELMLNLLESDASHTKALEDCGLTDLQLTKTKDKVRQICADIQAQGRAKHLNLDNITVGHLSMETLLSLTSKRAGEWFKEELRELGGLEHIIKTVVECCKHVDDTANAWSATSLEKIRKVDRCLRVLENITMLNEQNNEYLLEYQNGILIDTLVRMFKVCDYEIPLYPTYSISDKESTGTVLRECLIANLKVLINVTHDYQRKSNGSSIIGSRPGVIESSLHVLFQVPQYIPKEEKFDLMLLTLIMLINLVQYCESNKRAIIEAKAPSNEESIFDAKEQEPAVKALIQMFYNYEELARNEEKKTDAILEGENSTKPPTDAPQKAKEEFIEETISQLVQKAGQNMEHTLIAAYIAMLIGYLIVGHKEYEKVVREQLPEYNFKFMIAVLQKFYSFMTLTASGGTVSSRDMKSIQTVIHKLIESDRCHGFESQSVQASSSESLKNFNNYDGSDLAAIQNKFCESQILSDVTISAS